MSSCVGGVSQLSKMSQNEKGLCLCVKVSAEVSVLCIDMILRIFIYTFETHQIKSRKGVITVVLVDVLSRHSGRYPLRSY